MALGVIVMRLSNRNVGFCIEVTYLPYSSLITTVKFALNAALHGRIRVAQVYTHSNH